MINGTTPVQTSIQGPVPAMLSHVQFRADAFPACESEAEDVNPGIFGKRLAEFLAKELGDRGEPVGAPTAEDWGWVLPIENIDFRLWVGVGNYAESPDSFLCFIEPHKEYVRRFFRKISTVNRVSQLRENIESALRSDSRIRDIKWWTHDEFNAC